MSLRRVVSGAFKRSSSAISLIILISFVVMILSTAYHMLAFTPAQFSEKPETQGYENRMENVTAMDDWTLTLYYWSNNLGVAGMYAITAPANLGFNSLLLSDYHFGISFTYWFHQEGAVGMLAWAGSVFVHGLLELTGIYIVTAASLRLAWNLWKGMGHMFTVARKRGELSLKKFLSPKPARWEMREYRKHKGAIKQLLVDFVVVVSVGAFLIFLAAPVESYISPCVGASFYMVPVLGAIFLIVVGLWYASVVAKGFKAMRGDLESVWGDARLAFKGRWRPTQFALLILVIFSMLMLIRLML